MQLLRRGGRIAAVVGCATDKLGFRLSIAVTIAVLAVYLLTLSPGVSWAHHSEDSGDLITAAWVAGIPHPTGYPLFTMLGWLWSHIFAIGSVAWRMNAFSALWGALACGVTVRLIWRSFDLLEADAGARMPVPLRALASASGGLLLGFSTYVWQQSVVTEVYTLNLFFTCLVTRVLVEMLARRQEAGDLKREQDAANWQNKRKRLICLLGLSWGLALTNHMMSLFLLPGIALVLMLGDLRARPGEILKGAFCALLPLSLYAYLPIRSAMDPPLDYGNPETWDGFVWMVTGKQFRRIMFSLLPYMSLHQIMRYYSMPLQLGMVGALAAIIGLMRMISSKSRAVAVLAAYCFLLVAISLFFLSSYSIWDPEGYTLSTNLAGSIWAGWAAGAVTLLPAAVSKRASKPGAGRVWLSALMAALLGLAPFAAVAGHWSDCDLSDNFDAIDYGEESFASFEPNALVIEVRYERAFVMWYYREVEYAATRPDVAIVYVEHMVFQWGLDLLRRKYPDLAVPEHPLGGRYPHATSEEWMIRHNISKRPIYTGELVPALMNEGYRFEAVGLLYRVYPPEEGNRAE